VFAGHAGDVLVASDRGIDFSEDDVFLLGTGQGQRPARGVGDSACADEAKPSLPAHPIDRHRIHLVFQPSGVDQELGELLRPRGPVGRQQNDVGSLECHGARALGEGSVVADVEANASQAGLVHPETQISGVHEAVHSQIGQMHLAVRAHHPLRSNQDRRIEAAVPVLFQHSQNQVDPGSAAETCQELGGGTGNGFGVGKGFLQAVETVARQGAFGKDHQSSLPGDGLLHRIDHPRQVGLLVHQGGVHLHPGQREFFRLGRRLHGSRLDEELK